jgi:phosphoglycolate phosphatase-like HAD superfamily hydrolase
MTEILAVLLDVDGTLLDSNDAHARAWVEALREHKVFASTERIRWLIGMGGDKILPQVAQVEADSELGQRISARRRELFLRHHLADCRPFRGTRALIERIQDDGRRCLIASSAQQEELGPLLKQAGIADLIGSAHSPADQVESKPDPDIVCAALARGQLQPEQAIMLGDTPYDVEAAMRAGVPIIALRCGGWDADSLCGAHAVFADPADLLKHYGESLLATGADATALPQRRRAQRQR